MAQIGNILRHDAYYFDGGQPKRKYLLVLSVYPDGDILYRLLTSRQNARPKMPPCFRGLPYPGFFLGIPGKDLPKESWLDLRECADMDVLEYRRRKKKGMLEVVGSITGIQLHDVIECCAFATDTTKRQRHTLLLTKQALEN